MGAAKKTDKSISPIILVEDVMVTKVHCVKASMKLWEVAEFLISKGISGAPVVDQTGNLMTVIGEGALIRLAASEGLDATVMHCWQKLPGSSKLIKLKKGDTFTEAYKLFMTHNIHRIPIIDSADKVIGVISRGTILRMFVESHYQKRLPTGT